MNCLGLQVYVACIDWACTIIGAVTPAPEPNPFFSLYSFYSANLLFSLRSPRIQTCTYYDLVSQRKETNLVFFFNRRTNASDIYLFPFSTDPRRSKKTARRSQSKVTTNRTRCFCLSLAALSTSHVRKLFFFQDPFQTDQLFLSLFLLAKGPVRCNGMIK